MILLKTTLYLDSFGPIIQLLIGGIAAGLFAFRGYFSRIKAFITRTPLEPEIEEDLDLENEDLLEESEHLPN